MLKELFALFIFVIHSSAAEPTDFIRIDEDPEYARLQTSITTYEKGEQRITLLGAVHIADVDYFKSLNEEFAKHEVVLFELIGGEDVAKHLTGQGPGVEQKPDGRPAEGLRDIYGSFARTMKLAEQIHYIDYSAKNLVHADLTRAEYDTIVKEKGDELLAFAFVTNAKSEEITGKAFGGLNMGLLTRAMLSGDSSGLKLQLMQNMDSGDEAAAAITGQNVVIDDRNTKCFRVLDNQLEAGKKDIGIFYGAAHFPDMEERLLEKGFQKKDHRWLTAWNVKKPQ